MYYLRLVSHPVTLPVTFEFHNETRYRPTNHVNSGGDYIVSESIYPYAAAGDCGTAVVRATEAILICTRHCFVCDTREDNSSFQISRQPSHRPRYFSSEIAFSKQEPLRRRLRTLLYRKRTRVEPKREVIGGRFARKRRYFRFFLLLFYGRFPTVGCSPRSSPERCSTSGSPPRTSSRP